MTFDPPISRRAYEELAEAYAAKIDTKPHNAYYERPATLSLLPEVRGLRVLDAGCGPGVYAEWMTNRGARVVAVDASPKMLALARARVGPRVAFIEADLGRELSFLEDAAFDLVVSPLVLDSLPDWDGVFREYHRVLRPGGHLVFSVGHPFFDFQYFGSERYFEIEAVACDWTGFGPRVTMPSYRRPLGAIIGPLLGAGFELVRLLEPKPTEQFREADPKSYAQLMRQPGFLCIKARKPSAEPARPECAARED
jgi:SAM-dependent methyltransferase